MTYIAPNATHGTATRANTKAVAKTYLIDISWSLLFLKDL
jgi:hypothetical protein